MDTNNTVQEKNSPYIGGINPMFGQNPSGPSPGLGANGMAPDMARVGGPMGGGFNDMGGPGGAPGRPPAAMSQNPTGGWVDLMDHRSLPPSLISFIPLLFLCSVSSFFASLHLFSLPACYMSTHLL